MSELKCYKVFDEHLVCNKFQYEVGKSYEMPESGIKLCEKGFHACERAIDCFNYKIFVPKNKVAEVILSGKIIKGKDKAVASKITIVREISWHELLYMVNPGKGNAGKGNTGDYNIGDSNTGDRNTGDWNSGDYNSGDYNTGNSNTGNSNTGNSNTGDCNTGDYNIGDSNTGDRNTGDWNSGDYNTGNSNTGNSNTGNSNTGDYNIGNCNTGDWNSGDRNFGFFNSKEGTVMMFNKDTGLTRDDIDNSSIEFPYCLYFDITKWVNQNDMTEQEKIAHPEYATMGGYQKEIPYKEAAIASISMATEKEKAQIRALPNYDPDVFEEIFGIRI